jgi:TonB-dependent starch-binding outer membrane protein SusC
MMNNYDRRSRLKILLGLLFLIGSNLIMAQENISGKIANSATGESLPGASIYIKGTTTGTTSDINGFFSIIADKGDTLVFNYIGFRTKEVEVKEFRFLEVFLQDDIGLLEEVVVVGFGSQKKSLVTGSISTISAQDLEDVPVQRVDQALQGRTSGVVVASNSGQPGSSATVRVRGITSLGDGANQPLWVVDGVIVDPGGIGYLNQSDIQSIEVLKDAASQAIYGARAAAGVILITTKQGSAGKLKVSYNSFAGFSAPAKKLDLLNAEQYAMLRNEASLAAGGNIIFDNPESLGQGTDWQDLIFNQSAFKQNHEVSISGGNEVSTFYSSIGYSDEQGIVASDISNFERLNLRFNSTHQINDWLKIGQNLGYARQKSIGLGNTNSEFGGPLSSAINLDPVTPAVITDPATANSSPYSTQPGIMRDENGNPYGISTYVGQEMSNPLAYIQTRLGNYGWSDDIVGNAFAEIQIIEGLKFRSAIGTKLSFWGGEAFTPVFHLNSTTINSTNSRWSGKNQQLNYNIDNTLSYQMSFSDHDFDFLIGQGANQANLSSSLSVTKFDLPANNFNDASMNFPVPTDQINAGAGEGQLHRVSSLFGRINYNYLGKYLFTSNFRRDGSSRFGSNNKYGYFPSVSAGWIASEENFWPENRVIDFMKFRGGYGVVGNDNIGDFAYLSTVGGGRNYAFGTAGDYYNGVSPNAPSNPDLRWEETTQINIGIETVFFQNLRFSFDWFQKITEDILMYPRIPGYVGAIGNPAANVASLNNTGIEFDLGYRERFANGLTIGITSNTSFLKNEVTDLGTDIEFLSGGNWFQASTYPITRTAIGQPINSFYGFKMLGIFQNQADIFRHINSDGELIQPNAKPGDIIWADLDGDGKITENDRTFLGNPTPTWTFGLTFNAAYKNFDLLIFGQGAGGHMIFQGLRRLDIANANYQTTALNRWTGEGTSNDYPRLVDGDPNNNFNNPSELYLEKGDYFRFKVLQLGYTLPASFLARYNIETIRINVTAENLLTITNYTGYDPEIGGGTMSIDRGYYPQARSILVGFNLNF